MVQLSHPYMTTGKTIGLAMWTSVGKVISLLFNTLSRFVMIFLPRGEPERGSRDVPELTLNVSAIEWGTESHRLMERPPFCPSDFPV